MIIYKNTVLLFVYDVLYFNLFVLFFFLLFNFFFFFFFLIAQPYYQSYLRNIKIMWKYFRAGMWNFSRIRKVLFQEYNFTSLHGN
jgi:hypothetical protein